MLRHGGGGLDGAGGIPFRFPIAVPDAPLLEIDTGDSGTSSVEASVVAEPFARHIGERQVREVQIIDPPDRGVVACTAALCLAEEDQFESKTAAIGGAHIAG